MILDINRKKITGIDPTAPPIAREIFLNTISLDILLFHGWPLWTNCPQNTDFVNGASLLVQMACFVIRTLRQGTTYFSLVGTKQVSTQVLQRCGIQRQVENCYHEFCWVRTSLKGKSLLVIILKIAWSSFIDVVWME